MSENVQKPAWPVMSLAQAHALMTAPGKPFEIVQAMVNGRPMRVWKNAQPTMREVFINARINHGPKTFLVLDDERATFEAFARASLHMAGALAAQGVVKGDRVAVAMRNLPEWPVVVLGALLLGAIATPLNAWGTGPELAYGLADSGAKVAVVDGPRWERIHDLLGDLPQSNFPQLRRVWVGRDDVPLNHPLAQALSLVLPATNDWGLLPDVLLPDVPLHTDDVATLLYTSGTTASAKGVLATHRCCTSTLMASAFSPQRSFVRRGEPIPDPAARLNQRTLLQAVPLFHTTGCHVNLFGALNTGAKLVLMHRWDPARALALIEAERITQVGGVPTIAWQLIEHPDFGRYDLSSLEAVAYGGAPASAGLVARLQALLPLAEPGIGWGMTETSGTFTHHGSEDYLHRPDSAGPALPVADMRIVDDAGHDLPCGQVGELWVRGPNVAVGYWNKPEQSEATFGGGWLRTGDLGTLDDEGFLTIVDRKKDMLIRGGENIYCAEVEAVLYQHPAVMDAGVVGQAHHTLGEEPVALVCFKPGLQASQDELRDFVRARLAAFKVPVRVLVCPDALPRNAAGKLMKPALRQLFAQLSATPSV
jgi:long-chain acyl-CoA synthetase